MTQPTPQLPDKQPTRVGFTGWHMLAIMVVFFAVVIAVNLFMASRALGSFSGTVVHNSYVASQQYNNWLAEGRRQQALGWAVTAVRSADGHIIAEVRDRAGAAITGITITGRADHPLGQATTIALHFAADGERWRSVDPLPQGRWSLRLRAAHAATHVDVVKDLE